MNKRYRIFKSRRQNDTTEKNNLSFLICSELLVCLEMLSESSDTEFRREVDGGVGTALDLILALLLRLSLPSSVGTTVADFARFSLSLRFKLIPFFLKKIKIDVKKSSLIKYDRYLYSCKQLF